MMILLILKLLLLTATLALFAYEFVKIIEYKTLLPDYVKAVYGDNEKLNKEQSFIHWFEKIYMFWFVCGLLTVTNPYCIAIIVTVIGVMSAFKKDTAKKFLIDAAISFILLGLFLYIECYHLLKSFF